MNVAELRPRKMYTTIITIMKVTTIVSCKLLMVFVMNDEVSIKYESLISEGRLR